MVKPRMSHKEYATFAERYIQKDQTKPDEYLQIYVCTGTGAVACLDGEFRRKDVGELRTIAVAAACRLLFRVVVIADVTYIYTCLDMHTYVGVKMTMYKVRMIINWALKICRPLSCLVSGCNS